MLQQVLRAFEEAHEPVNLVDLAHKLGIDKPALEGMIAYWVRKGRLKESQADSSCSAECGPTCASRSRPCPFVGKMPRIITLVGTDE